jgi:hypothetical protein
VDRWAGSTDFSDHLLADSVTDLALDTGNPQSLYVGNVSLGFIKSTDGGLTWRSLQIPGALPWWIWVNPAFSATIWAAPIYYGLWRSDTFGE